MSKILIVDDTESYLDMLSEALRSKGYETVTENDSVRAIDVAKTNEVDLVISDYAMSPYNGLQVLRELKKYDETLPVILITERQYQPEVVKEAEREGCLDFISKAATDTHGLVDFNDLFVKVNNALKLRKLLRENQRLRNKFRVENIIGSSRPMEEVFALIQKVAPTDCTVLIQGESGTGKELVARALHGLSNRATHPMIGINCAGMPEQLLESELFGHKRGSFTNAFTDKRGLFEEADGGTLLLDEVGALPLSLQAKLLRALQEREIRRVGENTTIKIDVRIIAAANQPLANMLKNGTFREDLFYRLSVIPIEVPPLRERKEDIPLLVAHFIKHSQARQFPQEVRIAPESLDILSEYHWPGNVRELQNVVERALVLCDGHTIQPADLPARVREGPPLPAVSVAGAENAPGIMPLPELVTALEREYCKRAIDHFKGDKKKAAEALKISLPAIYRKLKDGGSKDEPAE
jgi:DNA-binding NtrC family response regulator